MLRLFFLIFIFITTRSFAAELTQDQLSKIENYLNSITSAEADFLQLNQDGSLNEGKFYLQKPGRFRWEYVDQPVLVVANKKSLIYYDVELEQANYVPIEKSIAALITRQNIKFSGDIELLEASATDEAYIIRATRADQNDIGEFTFIFKRDPIALGKIELFDENGQKIVINFINLKINQTTYDKELFRVQDNRLR